MNILKYFIKFVIIINKKFRDFLLNSIFTITYLSFENLIVNFLIYFI